MLLRLDSHDGQGGTGRDTGQYSALHLCRPVVQTNAPALFYLAETAESMPLGRLDESERSTAEPGPAVYRQDFAGDEARFGGSEKGYGVGYLGSSAPAASRDHAGDAVDGLAAGPELFGGTR